MEIKLIVLVLDSQHFLQLRNTCESKNDSTIDNEQCGNLENDNLIAKESPELPPPLAS
jgi:hypothetical protein